MTEFPTKLSRLLDNRRKENTFRTLPPLHGSIDFFSNDYLGFARDENLFSKTFQILLKEEVSSNGSTGSRLLSGNHKLYGQLESLLASFYKAETALVFNSGYDANIGFFGAVPQRGDFIFYDEFIHASIREGIRLSNAKAYSFSHNDLTDLRQKVDLALRRNENKEVANIYIVTESIFSMDGDTPDLNAFVAYSKQHGFYLIIDEAHAVGTTGINGEGLVPHLGIENDVFARTVTFGKAFGCHGAAILGSKDLRDYLINFARPFIYTTALTPHTLATIIASHSFFNDIGENSRIKLMENIDFFKNQVSAKGMNKHFITSNYAIQSCVLPSNKKVKAVSKKLGDDGFEVKAILSPTVPEGQERLRFCIHSFNSKEEIGLVLQLLAKYI